MAEMVIGEKVDHETMGGARMHCSVSGLGDVLAASELDAIESARAYLAYMPANWKARPAVAEGAPPAGDKAPSDIVPTIRTPLLICPTHRQRRR